MDPPKAKGEKRDLLLTADYPPMMGGIATYFYNLWGELPADRAVMVAPDVEGAAAFDQRIPFRVYRKKYLLSHSWIGNLLRPILFFGYSLSVFRKESIRAVHCAHLLPTALSGLLLKRLFKVPYYVYVMGSEFVKYNRYPPLRVYMRTALRNAEKVIVISEFAKREVLRSSGIDEKRITIIFPGVDCSVFTPRPKDPDLLRRYHLEGKRVILSVARLDKNKGHDKVIEAMPLILQKVPNAVYVVPGAGPSETSLKVLVRRLHLEEKVIFPGPIPEGVLPLFYNLCDVFVLATLESQKPVMVEGFGIVFLEASACGKPVVAGRTGGAVEAVKEGVSGFLIDPFNIGEIASTTVRILNDPSLAASLGSQGRKMVVDHFDWDERVKAIGVLLEEGPAGTIRCSAKKSC